MKFYLFLVMWFSLAIASNNQIEEILQTGNNNFTGRMLSKVVQENPDKSLVLSAFSVLTPLAQLAMASEGNTHDELLNVIGFPNDNSIMAVYSLINRKIKSIPGVELKMANRIYIPLSYDLNDNFAALSKAVFKSGIQIVDFTNNIQTATEINNWVDTVTNHRIKNLINPWDLDEGIRALLVNILYFKGTWAKRFDKNRTAIKDFYINNEDYIKVPTMHLTDTFKYGVSFRLRAKILELPYSGNQSSMILILPNKVAGIRNLVDQLEDLSVLDQEMMNIYKQEVIVSIPKFKIETKIDLKTILKKLNVTKVFSEEADLSKLLKTHEKLFVSKAIQKSFIEINEEGAEAAASNWVVVMVKASPTPMPVFNANHPFIFVLRTNNINLFSGVYHGL